jgi:hypothetical protein
LWVYALLTSCESPCENQLPGDFCQGALAILVAPEQGKLLWFVNTRIVSLSLSGYVGPFLLHSKQGIILLCALIFIFDWLDIPADGTQPVEVPQLLGFLKTLEPTSAGIIVTGDFNSIPIDPAILVYISLHFISRGRKIYP